MWLCLQHFNELCDSALTEQDVRFKEEVCELCKDIKPCVLSYDPRRLPYYQRCTLEDPTA